MALMECSECGGTVSDKAAACPSCGAPVVDSTGRDSEGTIEKSETGEKAKKGGDSSTYWKVLIGIVVLLFLGGLCSDGGSQRSNKPSSSTRLSTSEAKELAATLLNLNGLLCAEVTSIRPLHLKDTYEVTCIEYRGGSTKKTYVLNATDGKAFEN